MFPQIVKKVGSKQKAVKTFLLPTAYCLLFAIYRLLPFLSGQDAGQL